MKSASVGTRVAHATASGHDAGRKCTAAEKSAVLMIGLKESPSVVAAFVVRFH